MCVDHVRVTVTDHQALIFGVGVQCLRRKVMDLRTCSQILLLLSQWEMKWEMKLPLRASYFKAESFEGQSHRSDILAKGSREEIIP